MLQFDQQRAEIRVLCDDEGTLLRRIPQKLNQPSVTSTQQLLVNSQDGTLWQKCFQAVGGANHHADVMTKMSTDMRSNCFVFDDWVCQVGNQSKQQQRINCD